MIGLVKLKVASGHFDEASANTKHLRAMGKLGQYEGAADALDARLAAAAGNRAGPER